VYMRLPAPVVGEYRKREIAKVDKCVVVMSIQVAYRNDRQCDNYNLK